MEEENREGGATEMREREYRAQEYSRRVRRMRRQRMEAAAQWAALAALLVSASTFIYVFFVQ